MTNTPIVGEMGRQHFDDSASSHDSHNVSTIPHHLRVLLSSYACEPGRGSEEGVGWNLVCQISRHHDVWVITAAEYRPAIERYLNTNPLPNVHWIYFDIPAWMRFWKKGERGRRVHYYLWQILAYKTAKDLHQAVDFDISQHLTYASYWRPSFLARLPIPFVWGPVGGAESVPPRYFRTLRLRGVLFELMHDVIMWASSTFDPFVRMNMRRSAIALANTERALQLIRQYGAQNARYVPGIALPEAEVERLGEAPIRENPDIVRFISLGRLIAWKGTHLAIEAFHRFHRDHPNSEYWIVGDGPEQQSLQALIQRHGLQGSVQILPGRKRAEALEALMQSDALLYPCLHDAPGWVCLEAMAAGRPVIYVLGQPDVPGAEETSLRVKDAACVEETIAGLADAMHTIAANPELKLRMGQKGRDLVRTAFTWEQRGQDFAEMYWDFVRQQRLAD